MKGHSINGKIDNKVFLTSIIISFSFEIVYSIDIGYKQQADIKWKLEDASSANVVGDEKDYKLITTATPTILQDTQYGFENSSLNVYHLAPQYEEYVYNTNGRTICGEYRQAFIAGPLYFMNAYLKIPYNHLSEGLLLPDKALAQIFKKPLSFFEVDLDLPLEYIEIISAMDKNILEDITNLSELTLNKILEQPLQTVQIQMALWGTDVLNAGFFMDYIVLSNTDKRCGRQCPAMIAASAEKVPLRWIKGLESIVSTIKTRHIDKLSSKSNPDSMLLSKFSEIPEPVLVSFRLLKTSTNDSKSVNKLTSDAILLMSYLREITLKYNIKAFTYFVFQLENLHRSTITTIKSLPLGVLKRIRKIPFEILSLFVGKGVGYIREIIYYLKQYVKFPLRQCKRKNRLAN